MMPTLVVSLILAGALSMNGRHAEWTAYLRRVGPIRVGMSVEDARRALREPGQPKRVLPSEGCSYWTSGALPKGVAIMLEGERIVRIDVSAAGITTASGVSVGDTEAKVKASYPGRIEVARTRTTSRRTTCGSSRAIARTRTSGSSLKPTADV